MGIKHLAACLLSAVCLGASAQEVGQSTNHQYSGDWVSFRLCGSDGKCYWRASTASADSSEMLALDWPEFDKFPVPVTQIILLVSFETMQRWQGNTDQIDGKLRVDLRPIRNTKLFRELNRSTRTLFTNIPPSAADASFINELKLGNTFRLRTTVNGYNYTSQFSLRGAAQAINRAQNAAARAYERASGGYDPYFDNPNFGSPQPQPQPRQKMPEEVYF